MTLKEVLGIGVIGAILIWLATLVIGATPNTTQAEAFYPEPTNYAVDAAGVLSTDQLQTLNENLKYMDTDKAQFAVVIVKTTAPLSIEEYGIKLAEKWKVGDVDTDNGAIIILATEDRKVRIEIGYGLEGDINDAAAGAIVDEHMIPELKAGNWYAGITAGLNALAARVN